MAGPVNNRSRAFTLIELLVVILIILIVSIVALPTVLPALSHRQVSEGARALQSALVGARDAAIRDNSPRGIRLLPDPAFNGINPATGLLDPALPLAASRIIPIGAAPDYSEGLVLRWPAGPLPIGVSSGPYPGPGTAAVPTPTWASLGQYAPLMLYEAVAGTDGLPNSPTSWFWNVRVGDRIQINKAGLWYTVVGPMNIGPSGGNNELFVNVGPPGTQPWLNPANNLPTELLLLVNGVDDDHNGWIDSGWDGVDNDARNGVDDIGEWETETWTGADLTLSTQSPYTIQRRPAPLGNAREVLMPSNVVVDLTTWSTTAERSRLPVNPFTGYVDILVNPNGSAVLTTLYSTPANVSLGGAFLHFWVAERSDVTAPSGTTAPTLPIGTLAQIATISGGSIVALPQAAPYASPTLRGESRILSLATATGRVLSLDDATFDNPAAPASGTGTYMAGWPFRGAVTGDGLSPAYIFVP